MGSNGDCGRNLRISRDFRAVCPAETPDGYVYPAGRKLEFCFNKVLGLELLICGNVQSGSGRSLVYVHPLSRCEHIQTVFRWYYAAVLRFHAEMVLPTDVELSFYYVLDIGA